MSQYSATTDKSGFLPLRLPSATKEISRTRLTLRLPPTLLVYSWGLQEIMMSHSAQVILAISITATLCLTARGWARYRLGRLSHPERE